MRSRGGRREKEVKGRMTKNLVWSAEGEVRCEVHAPALGTERWRKDGWREMTLGQRVDLEAELSHPPVCETCAAMTRRAS
jgi:hypothetical protein